MSKTPFYRVSIPYKYPFNTSVFSGFWLLLVVIRIFKSELFTIIGYGGGNIHYSTIYYIILCFVFSFYKAKRTKTSLLIALLLLVLFFLLLSFGSFFCFCIYIVVGLLLLWVDPSQTNASPHCNVFSHRLAS